MIIDNEQMGPTA